MDLPRPALLILPTAVCLLDRRLYPLEGSRPNDTSFSATVSVVDQLAIRFLQVKLDNRLVPVLPASPPKRVPVVGVA